VHLNTFIKHLKVNQEEEYSLSWVLVILVFFSFLELVPWFGWDMGWFVVILSEEVD